MSDWRASYRNWIRRYGFGPKGIMREMWREHRAEELRREEEARKVEEAIKAAVYARRDVLNRLGVPANTTEFITGRENFSEVSDSLRQLWAAVDALEKRTRGA